MQIGRFFCSLALKRRDTSGITFSGVALLCYSIHPFLRTQNIDATAIPIVTIFIKNQMSLVK